MLYILAQVSSIWADELFVPYALTRSADSRVSASHIGWDGPVYSAATFPATVWSQFKLDLKERETTNEIKREPDQKQGGEAAADLLPNESHATASISVLDR